jgi:hypothetical protein
MHNKLVSLNDQIVIAYTQEMFRQEVAPEVIQSLRQIANTYGYDRVTISKLSGSPFQDIRTAALFTKRRQIEGLQQSDIKSFELLLRKSDKVPYRSDRALKFSAWLSFVFSYS